LTTITASVFNLPRCRNLLTSIFVKMYISSPPQREPFCSGDRVPKNKLRFDQSTPGFLCRRRRALSSYMSGLLYQTWNEITPVITHLLAIVYSVIRPSSWRPVTALIFISQRCRQTPGVLTGHITLMQRVADLAKYFRRKSGTCSPTHLTVLTVPYIPKVYEPCHSFSLALDPFDENI